MSASKHQQILLDYISNSNLEIIVQNSIRTLIQGNFLPENPFGSLTRYFTQFAVKDDLNRCRKLARELKMNQLRDPEEYGVSRIDQNNDAWGLAHLMHYINTQHIRLLATTLRDSMSEFRKTYNENSIEVRVCIGGAETMKSGVLAYPEVASSQLTIRADCFVEAVSFETGFEIFANYVYDDMMAIGSNNSFNLIEEFYVEQGPTNNPKKLKFQQILENKQVFVSELKSATVQKRVSYVKMQLFTKDLRKLGERDIVRPITPSNYLVDQDTLIIDNFQYVHTKKYYILHFYNQREKLEFMAFEGVPLLSLFDCIYTNPDSARFYASTKYAKEQTPYGMEAMNVYRDYKRELILRNFLREKPMNLAWEMFSLALAYHQDNEFLELIEEMFQIFCHKCAKMHRIKRINKSLRVLVNSYYDTNFEHFKRLAEGLFVQYKEEMFTCFGDAFSGEMLAAKDTVAEMLKSISINQSKTLSFHSNTLKILERLDSLCKSLTKNTVEMLLVQCNRAQLLLTDIKHEFGMQEAITHANLLEEKQTEKVVSIKNQLKTMKLSQSSGLAVVLCEYLTATGVVDVLTNASQSILLSYPLLPNPLKVFAFELMCGVNKFDMLGDSNENIFETYCRFPEDREGYFMHRCSPDLGLGSLAVFGREDVLVVTNPDELGIFRSIFVDYELQREKIRGKIPRGHIFDMSFSVCGQSVVNQRMDQIQRTLWHIQYDVSLTGGSLNAATYAFIDIIINYALWLQSGTNGIIIGLFTPYSEEPLATFEDIVPTVQRKETAGLLFSAYQTNNPIWLRFLVPFPGRAAYNLPPHVYAIHAYFSLHYKEGASGKVLHLVSPTTLESVIKVFFDEDNIDLALNLEPNPMSPESLQEAMYDQSIQCKEVGQQYRSYLYKQFISLFQRNETRSSNYLRINKTTAVSLIEACEHTGAIIDLVLTAVNAPNKHNEDYLQSAFATYAEFCKELIYTERNVYLEGIQHSILTTFQAIELVLPLTDSLKYRRIAAYLRWIRNILKTQAVIALISTEKVIEFVESANKA